MKRAIGLGILCASAFVAASTMWLTSLAADAPEQTVPAVGTKVHFEGCVRRGVEHGCLFVLSTDGHGYNVTSGKSVLKVDQYAAGTGTVSPNQITYCMQGVVLDNI